MTRKQRQLLIGSSAVALLTAGYTLMKHWQRKQCVTHHNFYRDVALEDSFPASDPPSYSPATKAFTS